MIESEEPTFFQKLFSCCLNTNQGTDINDLNLQRNSQEIIKNIGEKITDSLLLFDRKYIRDDEINVIKYTKEGIFAFIKKIQNLDYITKSEKNLIKISISQKSDLTSLIPIIRCEIILPKSRFINPPPILDIARINFSPEERLKWDKDIKSYEIINKISSDTSINKIITQKQILIISEREFYNKRCEFMDDGIYYSFSTSIPDDIFPLKSEILRVKNYFTIFVISHDINNYYFDSISQIDFKSSMNIDLMIGPLPLKTKDFYDKLVAYFNEISE